MAILLTAILLVTNTLPVVAAGDSTEPVPTVKPTATLTIETVGEGTVKCTGDGVTETGDNTYSVPSETRVLAQAQPSDGFTWKQTLLNGSEVKDSFTMPETDSILKVVFESFPKEEKVVEEASEDQPVETDVPQAENLPEEKVEQPETISSDDEEYVVNSKGIKVKKSLLCDDLNCLEKHVGATLDPDTFPVQEVSLPYSQFVSSSDERILEDVYVGMKTSGSNCAVHFWGTPGTGTGHFELQIHDGGLAGATGTGWCVNHGAANPGEYSWVICTYEATCTSVSGNVATWSVTATPPGAWDGESFINGLPAGYQRVGMNVRVQFEEAKGNLEIAKSSAKPEFTNGNDNYSLANAVYGLYQNGKEVGRTLTDSNGWGIFKGYKKGNYILKEITPPKGYALDPTEYPVTINSSQTTRQEVKDYPQSDPVALLLGKVDAETNADKPQGSASLEGAEFTFKYYATQSKTDPALAGFSPVRTWVMKTNARGKTALSPTLKVSGDDFFYTSKGEPTLPLGTLTIQETKAPKGYLLNPEVYVRQITPAGSAEQVNTYNMPTIPETVQKGVIQLQKQSNEPDLGIATLKGAEYEVRNAEGTLVDTLVTNAQGKAQSKELPLGTYTVKESKAPNHFLRDGEIHTVVLSPKNTTDRIFYETVNSIETLQKGIIELQKLDSETNAEKPQGDASLKRAVYDIFLKSAYQPGDGVGSKSYRQTLTTDEKGFAKSTELLLDTYYVIERTPSEGYLVDPEIHEVSLTPKNTTDRVFTEKVTSKEEIIRGNVEIIKLKENEDNENDTLQGLEGVEFTFTSDTTGKVVKKIVTDKNGFATTVDKDNPRGGLLFDTYTVTETKCPEGLKPIEPFKVTIKEEGVTLNGIYKEDKIIVSPVSVVKMDASTGKVIPVANTEFRLLDENKKPIKMTTHYPNKVEHTTFKTDENGQFTFPDKLKYGTYYLEELKAPHGYLKGQLLEFKVTSGANWGNPLIVKYADENAMGKITIQKTDKENGDPISGAVFEVKAAKDIITPDGTIRVTKGEVVDTLTTVNGTATTKTLFLGNYDVVEIKSAPGYVLNKKAYQVELKYKDQNTAIVTESVAIKNKPTEIELLKVDDETEEPMEGVTFRIWQKPTADQGNQPVFDQEFTTNEKGIINVKRLHPGTYFIQEIKTLPGYVLNDKIMELTIDKDGFIDGEEKAEIILGNNFTKVDLSKHDLTTGKEIEGGKYQVLDPDGKVVDEWTGTKEPHRITRLEIGKTYLFREIVAPYGYLLTLDVEFTVENTGEVQKVEMFDELAMGTITVQKTDKETKDPISGAVFEVKAVEDIVTPDGTTRVKKGEVVDTLTTDKGFATSKPLFLGKYEVIETKAAPGYIKGDKVYNVELKYKDQNTPVVTETVEVTNVPTTVIIEKVEKGSKKPLKGVTYKIWNQAMESQLDGNMAMKQEYVTDKDGKITLKYLISGTYQIQEVKTLPGYVLDKKIYTFVVRENGLVEYETSKDPTGTMEIILENDFTKLEISKQDATTGKELPGAKLELIEKETGKVIDKWTSGKEPHYIEKLVPGEYILKETLAPKGYLIAEEITFTLKETGEIQKVVMKDKYSVGGLTPKLPGNGGSGSNTSAKTGDTTNMVYWLILALLSMGALSCVVIYNNRRKEGKDEE